MAADYLLGTGKESRDGEASDRREWQTVKCASKAVQTHNAKLKARCRVENGPRSRFLAEKSLP